MRALTTVLLLTFLIGCDAPAPAPVTKEAGIQGLSLPSGYNAAEESIHAGSLLADVSIIASDEFEGRGAGSEGDRKARAHLAGRLREIGYEPMVESGSYEQPVEIVG